MGHRMIGGHRYSPEPQPVSSRYRAPIGKATVAQRECQMPEDLRWKILSELAKHTGKRVPWRFLNQTSNFVPGIDRFHSLFSVCPNPPGRIMP